MCNVSIAEKCDPIIEKEHMPICAATPYIRSAKYSETVHDALQHHYCVASVLRTGSKQLSWYIPLTHNKSHTLNTRQASQLRLNELGMVVAPESRAGCFALSSKGGNYTTQILRIMAMKMNCSHRNTPGSHRRYPGRGLPSQTLLLEHKTSHGTSQTGTSTGTRNKFIDSQLKSNQNHPHSKQSHTRRNT